MILPDEARIVGVLLAAGRSERFGKDKLLAPLPRGAGGTAAPVAIAVAACRHLLDALPETIAVVRPEAAALAAQLRALGAAPVPCPLADEGMSASLACGIGAAADANGWVIALGDMPWVDSATIRSIAAALRSGATIAVPVSGGVRGHPVGFNARLRHELMNLAGDRGAKAVLAAHAAEVVEIETGDGGVLRDVDTPEDLR